MVQLQESGVPSLFSQSRCCLLVLLFCTEMDLAWEREGSACRLCLNEGGMCRGRRAAELWSPAKSRSMLLSGLWGQEASIPDVYV